MDWLKSPRAIVVVALVLIIAVPTLIWRTEARRAKPEFVSAVNAGQVHNVPIGLKEKTWTSAETATVQLKKVPIGRGRRQALARLFNPGVVVPGDNFDMQATMMDNETGIRHVFGRMRTDPHHWIWYGIHPDSMELHIRLRQEEVEAIKSLSK
ncbi:MAG: hypothetical protein AMXMBFR84_17200 [Candidatus Hydrogenedentota bacterium]